MADARTHAALLAAELAATPTRLLHTHDSGPRFSGGTKQTSECTCWHVPRTRPETLPAITAVGDYRAVAAFAERLAALGGRFSAGDFLSRGGFFAGAGFFAASCFSAAGFFGAAGWLGAARLAPRRGRPAGARAARSAKRSTACWNVSSSTVIPLGSVA